MKFISYYDSPLGKITLAGDEAGLCGLWFEGEKYYAHALAASGADKKQSSADLLTKKQHTASETQRDFTALKKSTKSDFAAKAASGADEKYNARNFAAKAASGADVKFCAYDFAAQGASKKSYATDLSAQSAGEKFYINEQGGYFEEKNLAVFDQTRRWLDLYFSERRVLRPL